MKIEIELRDCEIMGLPKHETKEGQHYRFHRRGLERCLPEISSSGYAELGLSLAAAIALLESKPKTSAGKITLSAGEAETLRRILQEYKIVQEKYTEAACRARGLLAVVDEAGKLYREGKRSAAVMKIDWTSGKRRQVVPHADIFANYLLMIGIPGPLQKNKIEALKILQKRFGLQSEAAVLHSLKRTFATLKRTMPDLAGVLPNTWEKI